MGTKADRADKALHRLWAHAIAVELVRPEMDLSEAVETVQDWIDWLKEQLGEYAKMTIRLVSSADAEIDRLRKELAQNQEAPRNLGGEIVDGKFRHTQDIESRPSDAVFKGPPEVRIDGVRFGVMLDGSMVQDTSVPRGRFHVNPKRNPGVTEPLPVVGVKLTLRLREYTPDDIAAIKEWINNHLYPRSIPPVQED